MMEPDETEIEKMVEKGTKAWAGVPDNWLEELRGGSDELVDADLQSDGHTVRLLAKDSQTKESEIAYENGRAWVCQDKKNDCYTVFIAGVTTHISTSDSSYEMTEDGLSIAKARCDYLAKPRETT
jgi:hypothetical protein